MKVIPQQRANRGTSTVLGYGIPRPNAMRGHSNVTKHHHYTNEYNPVQIVSNEIQYNMNYNCVSKINYNNILQLNLNT